MFIKYICPSCKETRYFSSVKKDEVLCKNCGNVMTTTKNDIVVEVMTTEESRYIGDEAIFNTVGSRITDKFKSHTV